MDPQMPSTSGVFPSPTPGLTVPPRRALAGLVRAVALTVEGVGLIVSGLSLGYIFADLHSNGTNYLALESDFFQTLEAGIVIAGVGVILLGLSAYLDSRPS